MSISIIAFAVMASVIILFVAATVVSEMEIKLPQLTQSGDSSLSPQSVNWLGATAFITALLICLI
jgi:protein-S-isoprenylcysteine O-methyltransferase Ste14